jgi:hypothetical protein
MQATPTTTDLPWRNIPPPLSTNSSSMCGSSPSLVSNVVGLRTVVDEHGTMHPARQPTLQMGAGVTLSEANVSTAAPSSHERCGTSCPHRPSGDTVFARDWSTASGQSGPSVGAGPLPTRRSRATKSAFPTSSRPPAASDSQLSVRLRISKDLVVAQSSPAYGWTLRSTGIAHGGPFPRRLAVGIT